MNLKFINSILLVTLFLDSIQSKCISNETIGTTGMKPSDDSTESTPPFVGVFCTAPYNIKPYAILNQKAITDYKITKITKLKLQAELATCSCADKCQYTTNCLYFESTINSSVYNDCFLYQFNTPITQQLKTNLRRGIYYAQSFNMDCGLSNILF
jgi:hypothetical protein